MFHTIFWPPWFTYWKTIYSALFCCLVSDTSSTVMPFKGETNIIFVHKSAVFTSSSGQLTSWVRDRLKMRTRTVGEPHSCVLFPYKAVPITADASDSVTFFFFAARRVWLQRERVVRSIHPRRHGKCSHDSLYFLPSITVCSHQHSWETSQRRYW